jgi:hypothetical protein
VCCATFTTTETGTFNNIITLILISLSIMLRTRGGTPPYARLNVVACTASSSWWSVLIVRSPERNTMASLGEEHLALALHPSNDDERVAQLRPKDSASARVHAHQTAMRRMILRWRWDCHPSPAITSMNKLLGSILRNLPLLG